VQNFIKKSDKSAEGLSPDGKISLVGWKVLIELLITKNNVKVPWTMLRFFGYDDNLNLILDADNVPVGGLSREAVNFLTKSFRRYASSDNASSSDLTKFFAVLSGSTLPPWHPARRLEFFSKAFSAPKLNQSTRRRLREIESKRQNMNLSLNTPDTSLVIPEGDEDEDEDDNGNFTLPPLSETEWLTKWHLCSTISPHLTNILLFQLGFDIFQEDVSTVYEERTTTDEKTATSVNINNKLCLHCCVIGTPVAAKRRFVNSLVGADEDNDDDEHDNNDDGLVNLSSVAGPINVCPGNSKQYAVFTDVHTSWHSINSNVFDMVVLTFDSDIHSLEYAIEMEGKLPDTVRRIFVYVGGAGEDVFNVAVEHCNLFDLEPPIRGGGLSVAEACVLALDDVKKTRPLMEEKRLRKRNEKIMFGVLGASVLLGGCSLLVYKNREKLAPLMREKLTSMKKIIKT